MAVLEAHALSEGEGRGRPAALGGRGILVISEECVYLKPPPGTENLVVATGLTLAWVNVDVSWDPEERAITFKFQGSDDPPLRLVEGTEISVGGSGFILDPNDPEFHPEARYNWLAEPHPSCPDDLWGTNSVEVHQ
jgi:hypothetical protein